MSSQEVVCDKCKAVLANAGLMAEHTATVHNFIEKKEGETAAVAAPKPATTATATATTGKEPVK